MVKNFSNKLKALSGHKKVTTRHRRLQQQYTEASCDHGIQLLVSVPTNHSGYRAYHLPICSYRSLRSLFLSLASSLCSPLWTLVETSLLASTFKSSVNTKPSRSSFIARLNNEELYYVDKVASEGRRATLQVKLIPDSRFLFAQTMKWLIVSQDQVQWKNAILDFNVTHQGLLDSYRKFSHWS